MNPWLIRFDDVDEPDLDILEEAALAMAQATIQNAINRTGIKRAELARRLNRPRSFVSRMLSGDHNLTIRTMARTLAACGREIRFGSEPLARNWPCSEHPLVTIDVGQTVGSDPTAQPPAVAA